MNMTRTKQWRIYKKKYDEAVKELEDLKLQIRRVVINFRDKNVVEIFNELLKIVNEEE